MTLMDVMERLVEENIEFRFVPGLGSKHIYVNGKNHNGIVPSIRISIEDGQIYRRNANIVGFVPIDVLIQEIRELI